MYTNQSLEQNKPDQEVINKLHGTRLPDLVLVSTNNERISLINLTGTVVLYFYPMTGRPDTPAPEDWDVIPGAKGCTPQSCGFRNHYTELKMLDANVFGVSSQSTEYQHEAKARLHLPFELLSDSSFKLKKHLNLPTFDDAGFELYKRITLIAHDGVISKVFYPISKPAENVDDVINWLKTKN
jgi:peroxiredoxin